MELGQFWHRITKVVGSWSTLPVLIAEVCTVIDRPGLDSSYLSYPSISFVCQVCVWNTSLLFTSRVSSRGYNEATWRCCEPTCLSLGSLFDLDLWDLWPWHLWPLTYRLHMKCTMQRPWNRVLFTHVTLTFDLRPWPWTRWPLILTLVTLNFDATCQIHCVKSLKITFFDMVTLTFDL